MSEGVQHQGFGSWSFEACGSACGIELGSWEFGGPKCLSSSSLCCTTFLGTYCVVAGQVVLLEGPMSSGRAGFHHVPWFCLPGIKVESTWMQVFEFETCDKCVKDLVRGQSVWSYCYFHQYLNHLPTRSGILLTIENWNLGKSMALTPHLSWEWGKRDAHKKSMHDDFINIKWTWRNLCCWFINIGQWEKAWGRLPGDECLVWPRLYTATTPSTYCPPFHSLQRCSCCGGHVVSAEHQWTEDACATPITECWWTGCWWAVSDHVFLMYSCCQRAFLYTVLKCSFILLL